MRTPETVWLDRHASNLRPAKSRVPLRLAAGGKIVLGDEFHRIESILERGPRDQPGNHAGVKREAPGLDQHYLHTGDWAFAEALQYGGVAVPTPDKD